MARYGSTRCPLPCSAEQESLSQVSVIFQVMVIATEVLIDVIALEANPHYFSKQSTLCPFCKRLKAYLCLDAMASFCLCFSLK